MRHQDKCVQSRLHVAVVGSNGGGWGWAKPLPTLGAARRSATAQAYAAVPHHPAAGGGGAPAQTPIPPLTFLSSSADCRWHCSPPHSATTSYRRRPRLPPTAPVAPPCYGRLPLPPPPVAATPRCYCTLLPQQPAAAAHGCGRSRQAPLTPPAAACSCRRPPLPLPPPQVPRHKRLWPLEFDLSSQNVELLHKHRCSESMFSSTQCVRQGVTGLQAPEALKFRTPIRRCCRVHFLSLSGVSETMNIISVIILVHLYCEVRL